MFQKILKYTKFLKIKILEPNRKFTKIAALELETLKNVRSEFAIKSTSFDSEKILIDIYMEDDIKVINI